MYGFDKVILGFTRGGVDKNIYFRALSLFKDLLRGKFLLYRDGRIEVSVVMERDVWLRRGMVC